jgi:V8-like Glu-specific endopeptidase
MKTADLINKAIHQLPDLDVLQEHLEDVGPESILTRAFPPEDTNLHLDTPAPARPSGGFESMVTARPSDEIDTAIHSTRERYLDAGKRAVKKIRADGEKADLGVDEKRGLEAIILLEGRPAILIQNGKFFPPPNGWEILEQMRPAIEKNFLSVGRIEVTGHPGGLDWIGTGFLVAKDVIITNRHVAKEFCRMKNAKQWELEPGMTARIDYNEELNATAPAEFAIKSVIGVHDTYDLALFKVALKSSKKANAPTPLPVASAIAKAKKGRKVYVVGYPAADSRRNDFNEMSRIFSNIYNVKRFQPGEIMKLSPTKPLFEHDCSTLGGNSGSAVIDLETNQVIGLHFQGSYLESNSAIALWKLKDDLLLKKAGVNFV